VNDRRVMISAHPADIGKIAALLTSLGYDVTVATGCLAEQTVAARGFVDVARSLLASKSGTQQAVVAIAGNIEVLVDAEARKARAFGYAEAEADLRLLARAADDFLEPFGWNLRDHETWTTQQLEAVREAVLRVYNRLPEADG
jgi:hypothetical protein